MERWAIATPSVGAPNPLPAEGMLLGVDRV
jgi:hypothetical protein